MSMHHSFQDRMSALENQIQDVRSAEIAKSDQLASDLDVVTKRIGITAQELEKAHTVAEQLKQENAKTAQKLHTELASKADSQIVTQFRDEAANKLAEVQQDATTKIGAVSGDVQGVRTDLDTTRQDLASNRKDISDVRSEIARNSGELAALRRKGERDYIEFDMRKNNQFQRIADIQVQLRKTDPKRQKYTVLIQADDNRVEKKDLPANEPVQFLVVLAFPAIGALQTDLMVLALACGIGGMTTVFTLVDAVLLRPLPIAAPDQLVSLRDPSFS
jgi:chromosome segregation ATPase